MRVLVRNYVGNPFELRPRRPFGIDKQRGLTKRNRAEIFHCAGGKVGDRDQIQFVPWIRNPIISAEMFQRSLADIDGEGREMFLSGHGTNTQRRIANHDRRGRLEFADDESDEIGRHLHRIGEHNCFLISRQCVLAHHPGVGNCRELFIDD